MAEVTPSPVDSMSNNTQDSILHAPQGHQGQALTTQIDKVNDGAGKQQIKVGEVVEAVPVDHHGSASMLNGGTPPEESTVQEALFSKAFKVLKRYGNFIGPGFLIAVAYIDPGNYATDVGAGAATQYAHLFIILMSNLFAIFLQSLSIKLGTVTGLNLAQNCQKHLPNWLNLFLYVLAETAIIATDVAEVIGTAIALNLLIKCPLIAGCVISLGDVVIVWLLYDPDGKIGGRRRALEFVVSCLVIGVMLCFCIQLSYVHNASAGHIFRGYLPSSAVVQGNGIYLSCGILGATVMRHSLFLGSGMVQARLQKFDTQHGQVMELTPTAQGSSNVDTKDQASIDAIKNCLRYSIFELASSLFSFALFINSAILIVAGSALYPETPATQADLFGIYHLLHKTVSKGASIVFGIALLISGISAGIVCTMAGQQISEGMINWQCKPWVRRLVTRLLAIVPSVAIAAAVGKEGLNSALTASQVVLSIILPFVTAPLLWFTCRSNIMTVKADGRGTETRDVNMRNGWIVAVFAVLIWLVLVVMNVALIVLVCMGKA